MKRLLSLAVLSSIAVTAAHAREYPIGGPVYANDMEIAANYLVGIDMAPMQPGMPMGQDAVHLETDVHATADNKWGFADSEWIPYLTITYLLTKNGDPQFRAIGQLMPMSAKDGAHYANNVSMDGPGSYTVTLRYESPQSNGYMHHVDKATGIPDWWAPFTKSFTFKYPQ
jgi:uncharacterized protein involved in high-affinity Fe2+ transport